MKKTLLFTFCILFFINLKSQSIDASLVEISLYGDSHPRNIVKGSDNKVYFSAIDGVHGRELWVHDLETEETRLVKDIIAGAASGINFSSFFMLDNILYFSAYNNSKLCRSDGTEEGTYMVGDVSINSFYNPEDATYSTSLINYNGNLIFIGIDNEHGSELWISDGTAEGTYMIKDINPGANGSYISKPYIFNGYIYFSAYSSEYGRELWRSDGTTEGTTLFKDIREGTSMPGTHGSMIIMDDHFYFFGDGGTGMELWKSDGTPEGTLLLKEIVTGYSGLINKNIQGETLDGYFIFYARYGSLMSELWKSDGTEEGTSIIESINVNTDGIDHFSNFTIFNNSIYFTGNFLSSSGKEIWKSNGTAQNTQLVKTINGGIENFTKAQDFLIFSVRTSNTATPWISDGTTEGTTQLTSLEIVTDSQVYMGFYPINDMVFFPALASEKRGNELWKTHGVPNDVELVAEINHSSSSLAQERRFAETLGDNLIFIARDDEEGAKLFISDGTALGTHILKHINPIYYINTFGIGDDDVKVFHKAGDKLYFKANNSESGYEIFCTDGTEEGTHIVKDIAPGITGSIDEYPYYMEHEGIFYFKANDQVHGNELWRTDGTEEGTYMVKDINPGSASGINFSNNLFYTPLAYCSLNGELYFSATDTGFGIWKTDGTEEGTVKVVSLGSTPGTIIGATDNKVFYVNNIGNTGFNFNTVWCTDGTEEGTVFLKTFSQGSPTQFSYSCVMNNEIYFDVFSPETGYSLAKSDGTPEGTVIVKGNLFVNDGTKFRYMTSCGERVYFVTGNLNAPIGKNLWSSDGTEEGTILLADDTQENFDFFRSFICDENLLYYIQENSGSDIWVTDGTTESTYPITMNVVNGESFGQSSFYGIKTILGFINDQIYFSGNTISSGNELYITGEGVLGIHNPTEALTDKQNEVNNFIVYPNPTKGDFTISSVNEASIDNIVIYDFTGKKITERSINFTSATFNLSGLAKGIYFCKIKSNNTYITKKVVLN